MHRNRHRDANLLLPSLVPYEGDAQALDEGRMIPIAVAYAQTLAWQPSGVPGVGGVDEQSLVALPYQYDV